VVLEAPEAAWLTHLAVVVWVALVIPISSFQLQHDSIVEVHHTTYEYQWRYLVNLTAAVHHLHFYLSFSSTDKTTKIKVKKVK